MRAILGAVVWLVLVLGALLAQARQLKYIVNKSGGIHTVPDEYAYAAGDRDATADEVADYQAAFEDHSHDPPRQHPPIRPEVPMHNPPPASAARVLPGEPETIPSPPPPGTPVADTRPNPPEWAQDNPRVLAGQNAILPGPVADSGPTGADGQPVRARGRGSKATSAVQSAEQGPVPVAMDLQGAREPVYTDPAQRTEEAGLPAGSYPPNTTDQGLSIPDDVVTNDAAAVKASQAKAAGQLPPAGDPASTTGPGALAGADVPAPPPAPPEPSQGA